MKKRITLTFLFVCFLISCIGNTNYAVSETANSNSNLSSSIGTKDEFETLNDVYFSNSKEGWAVGNLSTIYHTSDGGACWNMQKAPMDTTLEAVYFTDSKNGIAVGGINLSAAKDLYKWKDVDPFDRAYRNCSYGIIFRTTDGGQTWKSINEKSVKSHIRPKSSHFLGWLYDVKFADKKLGWAVGEYGTILQTKDGGLTWNDIGGSKPINSTWLYSMHCTDRNKFYACGEDGKIFGSINGGNQWKLLYQIAKLPGNIASDNGFSYDQMAGQLDWRDIFFLPGGRIGWTVASNGAIMKTVNSGVTWFKQNSGFSDKVINCVDLKSVYFTDVKNGWIVGQMGKKILHTTDSGQTWKRYDMPNAEWLYGVFFNDKSNGIAVGDFGTIIKTTNGGSIWTYAHNMDKYQNTRAPLLAIHAHGDDEAIFMSGPITQFAYTQKIPTVSLRVTRDDRNTNRTGEVKWHEKIWASNYLNINTIRSFDETDTDAWPTEDNPKYPGTPAEKLAYKVKLWGGDEKVARQIVDVIRTWQPLVILSHDPVYGEYSKSCHLGSAYFTALANAEAADKDKFPELEDELGLKPWQPLKLYQLATSEDGLYDPYVEKVGPTTVTMVQDGNAKQATKALRCYVSQDYGLANFKSVADQFHRAFMYKDIQAPADDNNNMFEGIQLLQK